MSWRVCSAILFALFRIVHAQNATHWSEEDCEAKCPLPGYKIPPLVLLSLDGFASKFLDQVRIHALESIAKCGTRAKYMHSSYPTRTYPNHFTISTGLWVESHGVTDNYIYDPTVVDKLVDVRRVNNSGFFNGGWPIWREVKRQRGAKTACVMFAGCLQDPTEYKPDWTHTYTDHMPFEERVDKIVNWLLLPEAERPLFVAAYYQQPDKAAHDFAGQEELYAMLRAVDGYIDLLFSSLHSARLLHCVNVVIVSDHGMTDIRRTVSIDEPLANLSVVATTSAISRVWSVGGEESADRLASRFTCNTTQYRVFTRGSIPPRFHYSSTPRVGDVVLDGALGSRIEYVGSRPLWKLHRDHGHDFIEPDMRAIFFARGPSISPRVVLPPFQNVELFNLFSDLLGLESAVDTHGTPGLLDPALRHYQHDYDDEPQLGMASLSPDVCASRSSVFSLSLSGRCVARSGGLSQVSNTHGRTTMGVTRLPAKGDVSTPFIKRLSAVVQRAGISHALISSISGWLLPFLSKWTGEYGAMHALIGVSRQQERTQNDILFLSLHRCASGGVDHEVNPRKCQAEDSARVFSFAFPLVDSVYTTTSCMTRDYILKTYSASLRDIEHLIGGEFFAHSLYTSRRRLLLRTFINEELW